MFNKLWSRIFSLPKFESKAEAFFAKHSVTQTVLSAIAIFITIAIGYFSLVKPGTVVQGIDELIDATRESAAATHQVVAALEPDDAIEALMKRGYTFSKDAFWRAIRNEDDRSIRLFCTGAPRSWTSSSNFDKASIPQAARATLSDCHASENLVCDYQDLSKFDHYHLSDALYADAKHGLISLICGASIRRKLEQQVAKLQNAERTQLKDECQENYRLLEDTANKNTHIALRRNAVKMRIMELSAATNFRFPGSSLPEVCRSEFNIDFEHVLTEMRSH